MERNRWDASGRTAPAREGLAVSGRDDLYSDTLEEGGEAVSGTNTLQAEEEGGWY